uniref:Uncharacterized protein n=1 Tax=Arundo donax TaxID=35708 RepID=A0A0A8Y6S4_ARUDO
MKSSVCFGPKMAAQARSSNPWVAKSGPRRPGLLVNFTCKNSSK